MAANTTPIHTKVSNATTAIQLANQLTATIMNSKKQMNKYNNQQNASIHKDKSKTFFGF
jgi:hypothetical protein